MLMPYSIITNAFSSASAFRLGTPGRKDEQQLYHHTLQQEFGEANCYDLRFSEDI